jgi:hypothetical protein
MVRRILSTTKCRRSGSCRDRSVISSFIAGLIEVIRARYIAAIVITACLAGAATEAGAAEPYGRAYLFRGLIGMIDWGMNELAGRINRTGVQANIDSHLSWRSIADQAISDYRRDPKPITAIGHSIGGDHVAIEPPWTFTGYVDPRSDRCRIKSKSTARRRAQRGRDHPVALRCCVRKNTTVVEVAISC